MNRKQNKKKKEREEEEKNGEERGEMKSRYAGLPFKVGVFSTTQRAEKAGEPQMKENVSS